MELKELTKEEIELILENRKKATKSWEEEKEYMLKRAKLREEYEKEWSEDKKVSFEEFCLKKGLKEFYEDNNTI